MSRKPFLVGVLVGIVTAVGVMGSAQYALRTYCADGPLAVATAPLNAGPRASNPAGEIVAVDQSGANPLVLTQDYLGLRGNLILPPTGGEPSTVDPAVSPRLRALPPGWTQDEINGLTYYIVPLAPDR